MMGGQTFGAGNLVNFSVYIVWEVPGVFQGIFRPFTFLFAYTDPKKPSMEPLHEWFFRSGLDRYVWIYGMACAFFHPRYVNIPD